MAHAFNLLGDVHEVWLARTGVNTYRLHVDGASLRVTLSSKGDHAHELIVGDLVDHVYLAQRGEDLHVHLDGETYVLKYSDSLARFTSEATDDGQAVSAAPMPGSVISVAVQPGDKVDRGDPLLVIESMKMETTISATRDGVVQTVHVAVGQTFDRDAVLVTLERGETNP